MRAPGSTAGGETARARWHPAISSTTAMIAIGNLQGGMGGWGWGSGGGEEGLGFKVFSLGMFGDLGFGGWDQGSRMRGQGLGFIM